RRTAVHKRQHFVDLEIEDVARVVEQIESAQPTSDLEKDPPYSSEETRPLEAQILAVADASTRVTEHPAEDDVPQGMAGERRRHALPRLGTKIFGRRRRGDACG